MNSTALQNNITQESTSTEKIIHIVRTILLIVIFICFCFFFYFLKIILHVYFTTVHIQENARYMLFAHMLINDTTYLILGLLLMVFHIYIIYLPLPVCYILVSATFASFVVTPYNLAAMALERYVAVCFPLKHSEICTVQKSRLSIAVMWVTSLVPIMADIIAISSTVQRDRFPPNVWCSTITVTVTPLQNTIRSLSLIVSITLVGVIIVFTFVKVLLVAQKMGSGKSIASKAGRTVMLHAFQLLLSLSSLISGFTERSADNVLFLRILMFMSFMVIPRFLSPLIYGLRDEEIRTFMKKLHFKKM